MKKLILIIVFLSMVGPVLSQIRTGITFGPSFDLVCRKTAFITPNDNTVHLEDYHDHTLSLGLGFTSKDFYKDVVGFGFQIDLLNLNRDKMFPSDFSSIKGGVGVFLRTSKPDDNKKFLSLFLGPTFGSVRKPTKYLIGMENKQLMESGSVVLKIDEKDHRYFLRTVYIAFSIKLIYNF